MPFLSYQYSPNQLMYLEKDVNPKRGNY